MNRPSYCNPTREIHPALPDWIFLLRISDWFGPQNTGSQAGTQTPVALLFFCALQGWRENF